VRASEPDAWVWCGDIIYEDGADLDAARSKYATLAAQPDYRALTDRAQIYGCWDDHDYGENDGGRDFPHKAARQQLLLDFLGVPASHPRRQREGVYHSALLGPAGR
jgi:alkaline phosphatase D